MTDVLTASISGGYLQNQKESFSTLKMITAEAAETSVINSLSQDYADSSDLRSPTCIDSPGFKPFTLIKHFFNEPLQSEAYQR